VRWLAQHSVLMASGRAREQQLRERGRATHTGVGDPHVGLVDLPAVSHQVPAGPGNLGQRGVNRCTHW
jgi:hypothetical protein